MYWEPRVSFDAGCSQPSAATILANFAAALALSDIFAGENLSPGATIYVNINEKITLEMKNQNDTLILTMNDTILVKRRHG